MSKFQEQYRKLEEELNDFDEDCEFQDYADLLLNYCHNLDGTGFSAGQEAMVEEIERTLQVIAEIKEEQRIDDEADAAFTSKQELREAVDTVLEALKDPNTDPEMLIRINAFIAGLVEKI